MSLGQLWLVRRLLALAERVAVFRHLMRVLRVGVALLLAVVLALLFAGIIVDGARSIGGAGWALAILALVPFWLAYRVARRVVRGAWRGEYDLYQAPPRP